MNLCRRGHFTLFLTEAWQCFLIIHPQGHPSPPHRFWDVDLSFPPLTSLLCCSCSPPPFILHPCCHAPSFINSSSSGLTSLHSRLRLWQVEAISDSASKEEFIVKQESNRPPPPPPDVLMYGRVLKREAGDVFWFSPQREIREIPSAFPLKYLYFPLNMPDRFRRDPWSIPWGIC